MIEYIDAYRDRFGVEAICRTLKETECGFITSRGYRAAKTRAPAARSLSDALLIPELVRVDEDNFSVYGVRKMWKAMQRAGWNIGRDQTARLMKQAGIYGRRRGRTSMTTLRANVPDCRPDLVKRDFTAPAPHRLWVADITYVRTLSGFAYTAFITDVYSRKIVGVATRASMRTDELPLEAFEHALYHAGDLRSEGLSTTVTAAPSMCRSVTVKRSPRRVSIRLSAPLATPMTTRWLKRSTGSTKQS